MFKTKTFVNQLEIEKYEQIFYINNIKEGDTIFDVGANIGELTILFSHFASVNGCVHSFEPTPSTFKKLEIITKISKKKNVVLNNCAVYKESGFITLNIYNEKFASWNTIAERPLSEYGIKIDKPEKQQLPCISIDDYCAKYKISSIDLLKIDVEGAELDVLYGAQQMFEQKNIEICVFEFGQTIHDMGVSAKEIMDFFKKYSYTVKNIYNKQKLFPVDKTSNIAQFSIHYAMPK